MDRKSADRIIVKSNARMSMVLNWYYKNRDWLDKAEFHAPMDAGVIELQEEKIEMTFEAKGGVVEIAIYTAVKPYLPAVVTFDYDPNTWIANNYRIAPNLPKERRDLLRMVMMADKTDMKEALKYHTLMLFMAYYREVVTVEDKGVRSRHEAKKIQRDKTKPLPLIRKQYVIEEFDEKKLRLPGQKRKYTEPEHEVKVRGFYRHYKSGKVVWIEPFSKYKEKGSKGKKYEL